MLLKIALILLVLALALGVATIWRNGVSWSDPPGFWTRIAFYTMRNHVETKQKHALPELRPQAYSVPPKELYDQVQKTILSLGWRIDGFDPVKRHVHALVTTPILRFTDDFHVTVNPDSTLSIESSSRVGRADWGANLGHVLKFKRELSQRVKLSSNQGA